MYIILLYDPSHRWSFQGNVWGDSIIDPTYKFTRSLFYISNRTMFLRICVFFGVYFRPLYLFSVGWVPLYYWLSYVCTNHAALCHYFSRLPWDFVWFFDFLVLIPCLLCIFISFCLSFYFCVHLLRNFFVFCENWENGSNGKLFWLYWP